MTLTLRHSKYRRELHILFYESITMLICYSRKNNDREVRFLLKSTIQTHEKDDTDDADAVTFKRFY